MVKDCAPSHEIDKFEDILNLKGYENHNIGSKVTEILLNGWSLTISGASAMEGLLSMGPTPSSF